MAVYRYSYGLSNFCSCFDFSILGLDVFFFLGGFPHISSSSRNGDDLFSFTLRFFLYLFFTWLRLMTTVVGGDDVYQRESYLINIGDGSTFEA